LEEERELGRDCSFSAGFERDEGGEVSKSTRDVRAVFGRRGSSSLPECGKKLHGFRPRIFKINFKSTPRIVRRGCTNHNSRVLTASLYMGISSKSILCKPLRAWGQEKQRRRESYPCSDLPVKVFYSLKSGDRSKHGRRNLQTLSSVRCYKV
jgi:hypothetical protein